MGNGLGDARRTLLLALASALTGGLFRLVMAKTLFLQADEEIFSYDAYYFILGKDLDFIMERIGNYIGYPFILSLWFRVFGVSLFSARVLTVACWMMVIFITFFIVLEATRDRRAAFAGSLVIALLPFPLRYGSMALTEPLAWVFVSASLLLFAMALRRGRWYLYAISGALGVVGAFSRRSALVLLLMAVPLIVWTHRGSLGKAAAYSSAYIGGFLGPLVLFLGGLISYFGTSRLKEFGFFNVPNFTEDFALDVSSGDMFDNAAFVLQPTVAKSLPLFMLLCIGAAFIIGALMRDRWKAVYLFAGIYPPIVRIAFDGAVSEASMFILMVLPVSAVLFADRSKWGPRPLIAASVLLSSSAAFSTFVLTGDIWNVIIYTTVGATAVVYLEDRISGEVATPAMAVVGSVMAVIISVKENQMEKLIVTFASILPFAICMMAAAPVGRLPRGTYLGLVVPGILIAVLESSTLSWAACGILVAGGVVLFFIRDRESLFSKVRIGALIIGLAAASLIPGWVPVWMVLAIIAIAPLVALISSSRRLTAPAYAGMIILPIGSFLIAWRDSSELLNGAIASAIVLGMVTAALSYPVMVERVRRWTDPRTCAMIAMLVVAYMAFYVYYGWTEVYMVEFVVASAVIAGVVFHAFGGSTKAAGPSALTIKDEVRRVRRMMVPPDPGPLVKTAILVLLALSIPCSIGSFLGDGWFDEKAMDKRPYMRTIEEIAEWIDENSSPEEYIVAWHSFAVQAERQTLLSVSNAQVYDGKAVMQRMEEEGVRIFVLCYYTDHGLWQDQPEFQHYILRNFTVDLMVDGNACFIRR